MSSDGISASSAAQDRDSRDEEGFQRGQVQLLITPHVQVLHERWFGVGQAAFEMTSEPVAKHLAGATRPRQ